MRAESERAFQEGGDIISPSEGPGTKSFEEMKQRSRKRVIGDMAVLNPDGTVALMKAKRTEPTPMSKWELNRRAQQKTDLKELEEEAYERSVMSGGEGGRIEVYAGGAMEWVPNGPGGVPQPTTGDVFFDPIAEEQQKMERSAKMQNILKQLGENVPRDRFSQEKLKKMRQIYSGMEPRKFARGGVVKKFQAGGLAAANLDDDEDEIFDPASMTGVDEIIASAAPDVSPDMHRLAAMNRDTALQQLRAGQQEFQQRQARQQKQAEQDRWFALAQGMLAPTQTGGFGENIGMAAGALREQSAQQAVIEEKQALQHQKFAEREADIASDYYDALENLSGFKSTSRARVVGNNIGTDPRQEAAIKAGTLREEDADRVLLSTVMLPEGKTITRVETLGGVPLEKGGEPFRIIDPKKDPAQAAAQKAAVVTADQAVRSQVDVAKLGVSALPVMIRLQKAYSLLQTLKEDTSGLNEQIRTVAQWAGISEVIDDNTTLATLHSMFGRKVLDDLRLLTGSKTDFEYTQIEKQNAGLKKSVPENLMILDENMRMVNEMIDKGEFAAQQIAEGAGGGEKEFWLENYTRYRKSQAEAAMEYDAATRTAPPSKEDQLLGLYQQSTGNVEEQEYLIEAFEEHYDLTEEVRLQLRELGASL
jgi:hypothetical protein